MFSRTWLILGTLMLALLVSACGSSDDSSVDLAATDESDAAMSEPAMDGDYEESAAGDSADYSRDEGGEIAQQTQSGGIERRVIRNGELEIYVSDVELAVRHARETVEDYGGFIASSSSVALNDNGERSDLSIEVPAEEFDTVLGILRDGPHVVRVEHESTSSQDVTEEYVDLRSQLANLESTEARFVELLEDAISIADVLSVENEITRVRGEIERIQGRMNYLEQRTDYSRIHVGFYPEEDSIAVAGQHFTPSETARSAWNASMEFVGTIGNGLITIAVFFWWAWPLVAIAGFALYQYRRRRRLQTAV
jgi:hypothetical protein